METHELHNVLLRNINELCSSVENDRSRWPDYGCDWGPWIDWDGSDEYGPDGLVETSVNLYRRSPNSDHFRVQESHHVNWLHTGGPDDVLAYRIRQSEQKYVDANLNANCEEPSK